MLLPHEARNMILRSVPVVRQERVRLDNAYRRILAQDTRARSDSPEFDKAVRDGFALRARDVMGGVPVFLKCRESIPAGRASDKKLTKGECVKIATGAMLPPGADSVVMKEEARISGRRVEILKKIKKGAYVSLRARDVKKGDVLLKKGALLNAARIGLLASQGMGEVHVFQQPTVALLCTGDEVIEPGQDKKKGQIWNASAFMLGAALRRWGIKPHYLGVARDIRQEIFKKIKEGLKKDVLIITGAVSVGDLDLVPSVLKKTSAKIKFHKVAIRPGKPLLFAVKGRRRIFGLPGNPVSSLISFCFFVEPCLKKMMGLNGRMILESGVLTKDVYNESDRLSFFPARLTKNGGSLLLKPLRYGGSADLGAVSRADAFFVLGKNRKAVRGSQVSFFRMIS